MKFKEYWTNKNIPAFHKRKSLNMKELQEVRKLISAKEALGWSSSKIINTLQTNFKKLSKQWEAERAYWTEVKNLERMTTEQAATQLGFDKFRIVPSINACETCKGVTNNGNKVFKESEMIHKGRKIPPIHPNSVVTGSLPVLTSKGSKQIKNVKVGDLVLTHTGKFREVLATPREKKKEKMYSIHTDNGYIKVTGEHLILTQSGWKQAQDLCVKHDKVQYHYKYCKCGKKMPVLNKVCSSKCKYFGEIITKKAHEIVRNRGHYKMSDKSKLKKKEMLTKRNRSNKLRSLNSKRMKKENPMTIYPELRKRHSEFMKDMIDKNPKKHLNYILAKKGFISSLEKSIDNLLEDKQLEYTHQKRIGRYWVDFSLDTDKIAIECDGYYWHVEKATPESIKRNKQREEFIKSKGWTLLRFSEEDIVNNINKCEEELDRVLMNHAGEYHSEFVKINKLNIHNMRIPRMTYDLTVDKDESFVLNNIGVHNCYCVVIPLYK